MSATGLRNISDYRLRPAAPADSVALQALLSEPQVFEYLFDGAAPDAAVVDTLLVESVQAAAPFGLWMLERADGDVVGCVRLEPNRDEQAFAELTYVLHPDQWGQGLATAMSRSALTVAFAHVDCHAVLAGADLPNQRSIAVMRRLGMRFLREVDYPAGPGVEFLLTRDGFRAAPAGRSLRILPMSG